MATKKRTPAELKRRRAAEQKMTKSKAKRNSQRNKDDGSKTHVENPKGLRGVRTQESGDFEWKRVPRKGTSIRGGLVKTPRGGSVTTRGPDGTQKIGEETLVHVNKKKKARKK
jgi:hypothetical protein